jgi:hypothetical protein
MDDLPERRQRLKSKVIINACTDLPLAVFFSACPVAANRLDKRLKLVPSFRGTS